jgi:hypothetical protein
MTARTPTKRELREFDIDLPESSGVADFETFIGKEYLILAGTMYPGSGDEVDFWSGRRALKKLASLEYEQNDPNSDQGYVPYSWIEDIPKQLFVKVLYVNVPEQTSLGIVQPFSILCKIKYPVVFSVTPVQADMLIGVSTSVSAGMHIPAQIPAQIGSSTQAIGVVPFIVPVILGATPGTASVLLNNYGDLASYPTFVINGPIFNPKITNNSTGEYIGLNINLGAGQSAIIQYDQDSAPSLSANGINVYGDLTQGSTLFKIKPGNVALTLTGSSVGQGANASVSFSPAYPYS